LLDVKVRGKPRRIFYGWVVVVIGFVNQLINSGLGFQGIGTFVVPLENEFGWSKTQLSIGRSLMQVENGLFGPIEGTLVDRFGPRSVMASGMFLFGLGLVFVSLINSLWFFYFSFLVVAIGTSIGGFLVMSVSINNWFRRKRTLAMSLAQTGLGVSGLTIIPLLLVLHDTVGWRTAALGAGLAVWAVGIPVSLLMRNTPEEYGVLRDGDSMVENSVTLEEGGTSSHHLPSTGGGEIDFTLREALRTPAFWLIGFGHGLSVMVITAVAFHQFAHMEQGVGLSLAAAALVVGVLSAMNMAGRILGGILGDRYDKRYLAALGMGGAALAIIVFAIAQSLVIALVFAVIYGFFWGMRGPMMNSIRGDYFGRKSFGKIIGASSLLTMPGSLFGPIFAGRMADLQGNYVMGFTILGILSALGSFLFLIARPPQPPERFKKSPVIESPGGGVHRGPGSQRD
jgi:sugar phosphate permease